MSWWLKNVKMEVKLSLTHYSLPLSLQSDSSGTHDSSLNHSVQVYSFDYFWWILFLFITLKVFHARQYDSGIINGDIISWPTLMNFHSWVAQIQFYDDSCFWKKFYITNQSHHANMFFFYFKRRCFQIVWGCIIKKINF